MPVLQQRSRGQHEVGCEWDNSVMREEDKDNLVSIVMSIIVLVILMIQWANRTPM